MKKTLFILMIMGCMSNLFSQSPFFQDNFENASVPDVAAGSTRTPENNGGTTASYFKRSVNNAADISLAAAFGTNYAGMNGSYIWVGEDHDNPFGTGNEEQQIEWTNINIAGKTNLQFKGNFAANNTNGSWDNGTASGGSDPMGPNGSNDYIIVEYAIDAGSYSQLYLFIGDNDGLIAPFKSLREDANGDGKGEGIQLTNVLSEFTKSIAGIGTTMKLRIRARSNGGNEAWAIDDFRLLEAQPCPTPSLAISSTSVLCNGGSTGSATATVTGGSPFTYTWSPSGGNAATATGLGAGIYTCITTNSCGLTASNTVTISEPTAISLAVTAGSGSICIGQTTTLTATANGGTPSYTYTWSGGPNATTYTVNPVSTTIYNVSVLDGNGCSKSNTFTLTVNALPSVSLTSLAANNGTLTCKTLSVVVTPTVMPSNVNYIWTSYTGTISSQPTVTLTSAGIYTLTVVDPINGCVTSNTNTANTFTVYQNITVPTVTLSNLAVNNATITCNTLSIVVTPAITPSVANCAWTSSTGTISSKPTVTLTSAGIYTLTVMDPISGCATSNTNTANTYTIYQNITLPSFTLSNTAANSGTLTCKTLSVVVTPTVIPSYAIYTWTSSTGIISSQSTVTLTSAGIYTLTVVDPVNGCATSNTNTANMFTVLQNITFPMAILSNVATNSGTLTCNTLSIVVTPTIMPSSANYTWTASSGTISSQSTVTLTSAGIYTLTVVDPVNGCATSNTNTANMFTVKQNTIVPTISASTSNTLLCLGETATLTASGSATSYTWSSGGNTMNTYVSPTVQTTYTVNGKGANGCSNSATITQSVISCVGIQSINPMDVISVNPNPFNGSFNIIVPITTNVMILDVFGKVVYNQTVEAGKHSINLHDLANGLYFVKAISHDKVNTIRLIKE